MSLTPQSDLKINRKGDHYLPVFDGNPKEYKVWKGKLLDHIVEKHEYWRTLLHFAETSPRVIKFSDLTRQKWGIHTGWELSMDLWSFLSKRLGPTLYSNRIPLAHGVEGNGFELWRRLFCDNEGGDRVVQLDGRTELQNFTP